MDFREIPLFVPTFLHFIPSHPRHHPQFFPMLTPTSRRRVPLVSGVAAALGALALGLAGFSGLDAPTAGAHVARESSVSPFLAASASALGTAVGDSALGLQTPYFEPTQLQDPADPGYTIASGADQPDPFVYVQGGEYYLFTSQDEVPQNVPVRSGPGVGQWGAVTDALPDPPPWSVPGKMWAPDVAQFGNDYVLYFTSQLAGVTPQTMCIGDAVSTAVAGPYLASPTPLICQQSLGGSIDPRLRRRQRPALHDLEVGPERPGRPARPAHGRHPDLEPAAQRRRPGAAGRAHHDHAPGRGLAEPHRRGAATRARPRRVLALLLGRLVQPDQLRHRRRPLRRPARPVHRHVVHTLLASNAQGQGPGEESVFANGAGYWLAYTPFSSTLPLPGPPRPVQIAHLGFGPNGPYLAQAWEASTR